MGFSTFPNNPFPPSTAQFDEGKNYAESALATKTNLSNIAPAFDATSGVYGVGDKIIYEGVLYEFTSAHSTAGEWDESEVQPVKVSELIDSLKSGLTNVSGYVNAILTHADFLVYRGNMGTDPSYTSTDFNDYRFDGIFSNGDTSSFTNAPTSGPDNGYLIAFSGNCAVQIWIGKYLGSLRARTYSGGTWSSWSNLINA